MSDFPYCKLEIFIPEPHLEPLRQALLAVDAGHIGNYQAWRKAPAFRHGDISHTLFPRKDTIHGLY